MCMTGSYKAVSMCVFHKNILLITFICDLATCHLGQSLEDGITSDSKAVED